MEVSWWVVGTNRRRVQYIPEEVVQTNPVNFVVAMMGGFRGGASSISLVVWHNLSWHSVWIIVLIWKAIYEKKWITMCWCSCTSVSFKVCLTLTIKMRSHLALFNIYVPRGDNFWCHAKKTSLNQQGLCWFTSTTLVCIRKAEPSISFQWYMRCMGHRTSQALSTSSITTWRLVLLRRPHEARRIRLIPPKQMNKAHAEKLLPEHRRGGGLHQRLTAMSSRKS